MDLVKDLYGNGKLYRLSMDPSGIDISGETQVLRINSDKITGDLNIDGNVEINGNSNFDGNVEIDGNISTGNNNFVVTNTGNVGIGTNTPGSTLHVFDSISQYGHPSSYRADINQLRIDSLGYNTGLAFKFKGDWAGTIYDFDQARITTTGEVFNSQLHFDTAYYDTTKPAPNFATLATRMTIDHTGNVGIGTTLPSEKLEVDGRIKVPQNQLQDGTNIGGVIPSGGIIMWHGSEVPDGWALCNGQNGTPNLLDRFILGSSTNASGGTGGSHSITLTTDQIPSHSHNANMGNPSSNHKHSYTAARNYSCNGVWSSVCHEGNIKGANNGNHNTGNVSAWHTHSISVGNTGGGQAFDNRPAYYKLAYIMKL